MRAAVAALVALTTGYLLPSLSSAQDASERLSVEALSKGRFTRCGYNTVMRPTGYAERDALCIWTDDAGNAYQISVQVLCDERCRPVGEPQITAFYE